MAKRIKSILWKGDLPLSKWMLFYSRILKLLPDKDGLGVQVTISSCPDEGFSMVAFRDLVLAFKDLSLSTDLVIEEILVEGEEESQQVEAEGEDPATKAEDLDSVSWRNGGSDRNRSIRRSSRNNNDERALSVKIDEHIMVTDNNSSKRRNLGRLPQGERVSQEAFRIPILHILVEMGGSGSMIEVLSKLEIIMASRLREIDYLPLLSHPNVLRWKNTAQWTRRDMIVEGLLKGDSKRGTWEISEMGRAFLQQHLGSDE